MTDRTLTLAAAETALRNLPSTKKLGNETISLQAALDALRGVAGEAWQPIETAPHGEGINTGPPVLVGGGVFWDESETYPINRPLDRSAIGFHDPFTGWIIGNSETYGDSIVADPTHWMPLPEPPTTYRQKRGQDHD